MPYGLHEGKDHALFIFLSKYIERQLKYQRYFCKRVSLSKGEGKKIVEYVWKKQPFQFG